MARRKVNTELSKVASRAENATMEPINDPLAPPSAPGFKTCTTCFETKAVDEFYARKDGAQGVMARCQECTIAAASAWYQNNKEKKIAYDLEYNAKNRDKRNKQSATWAVRNKEKSLVIKARYRETHRDKLRAYNKIYGQKNPGVAKAKGARRRAREINATPPWLTAAHMREMRQIYENCPAAYHVDHIVPLQGKTVCGLHVPWNLQYLTAFENQSKGNRL